MKTKFKIGDYVIISNPYLEHYGIENHIGKIIDIDTYLIAYPYEIMFLHYDSSHTSFSKKCKDGYSDYFERKEISLCTSVLKIFLFKKKEKDFLKN